MPGALPRRPLARAVATLTDLLTLYEDCDALIDVVLASPRGPRQFQLAFGITGLLATLTRHIDQLAPERPDLVDALERARTAISVGS